MSVSVLILVVGAVGGWARLGGKLPNGAQLLSAGGGEMIEAERAERAEAGQGKRRTRRRRSRASPQMDTPPSIACEPLRVVCPLYSQSRAGHSAVETEEEVESAKKRGRGGEGKG